MAGAECNPGPGDPAAVGDPSGPGPAKLPLVVIAGPTASGKTGLGIELAIRFDGEVINADSRYLYRGFDIGVAKPDIAERRGVPHHLIDILPPTGEMSLAVYQELAMQAIAGAHGRGRLPLLVGGTSLYVNAVVEGWRIPRVPPNPELRRALAEEAATHGPEWLEDRLRAVDPLAADRAAGNLRRIIRALEVYRATGAPMSDQEGKGPPPFRALELRLTAPRATLYEKIDARADQLLAAGLLAEVRTLLEGGVPPDAPAMSSIGYRQLLPYLAGEGTLAEAVDRIKHETHRYVRHQETWLRRNPRLVPVDVTAVGWVETAARLVAAFLAEEPAASV